MDADVEGEFPREGAVMVIKSMGVGLKIYIYIVPHSALAEETEMLFPWLWSVKLGHKQGFLKARWKPLLSERIYSFKRPTETDQRGPHHPTNLKKSSDLYYTSKQHIRFQKKLFLPKSNKFAGMNTDYLLVLFIYEQLLFI